MTEEEETYRSFLYSWMRSKHKHWHLNVTKQDLLAIMFNCFVDVGIVSAYLACDGCATNPFDAMPRANIQESMNRMSRRLRFLPW